MNSPFGSHFKTVSGCRPSHVVKMVPCWGHLGKPVWMLSSSSLLRTQAEALSLGGWDEEKSISFINKECNIRLFALENKIYSTEDLGGFHLLNKITSPTLFSTYSTIEELRSTKTEPPLQQNDGLRVPAPAPTESGLPTYCFSTDEMPIALVTGLPGTCPKVHPSHSTLSPHTHTAGWGWGGKKRRMREAFGFSCKNFLSGY